MGVPSVGSSAILTLLLTDIEGSTTLLERLGDRAYAEELAAHRRVIRAVFGQHDGVEVDTQGDAFFYVFSDPAAAVTAAAQVQVELEPGPVRVRIGVHTGQVLRTEEGYAGRELHRAARIAASAHGGQVVVSETTRRLLRGVESPLTDLGEHRVKDFDDAIALFQVGATAFPPLRTISNTNLPTPPSAFVGRVTEREEVVALVREGVRMVTLTGPGGAGKTRLAIEAASELLPDFPGGVFWVPVAAVRDPAHVREAIARSLGGEDPAAEIRNRKLLVVLDNLEQIIDAAPDLAALVGQCPRLHVLVTSREVMRVPGECEYPVPPLSEGDAVEMFARLTRLPGDDATANDVRVLCARLDNMPLALEMAAARTSILAPAQILERLGQRLDLLRSGRGADPRQQTLRTTIEWSVDLLTEREKEVFATLSVFRGGALLEAAESVADADLDTLQSLVDKSLVRFADGRFTMLETIRAYAWEQLEGREHVDAVRERQARWLLGYCRAVTGHLSQGEIDSHVLRAQLEAEQDNMTAALEWADAVRDDRALIELVAVGRNQSLLYRDRETWAVRALERAEGPPSARMEVLAAVSQAAAERGDYETSALRIAEWLALAEREADVRQALLAQTFRGADEAEQGHFEQSRATFASVRTQAKDSHLDIYEAATVDLAETELQLGLFDAATRHASEAMRLAERAKDNTIQALALGVAACTALLAGDAVRSLAGYREALRLLLLLRNVPMACLQVSGAAAAFDALGDAELAARLLGGVAAIVDESGVVFENHVRRQNQMRGETESAARSVLGDERFDRAWREGAALSLDELATLIDVRAARHSTADEARPKEPPDT